MGLIAIALRLPIKYSIELRPKALRSTQRQQLILSKTWIVMMRLSTVWWFGENLQLEKPNLTQVRVDRNTSSSRWAFVSTYRRRSLEERPVGLPVYWAAYQAIPRVRADFAVRRKSIVSIFQLGYLYSTNCYPLTLMAGGYSSFRYLHGIMDRTRDEILLRVQYQKEYKAGGSIARSRRKLKLGTNRHQIFGRYKYHNGWVDGEKKSKFPKLEVVRMSARVSRSESAVKCLSSYLPISWPQHSIRLHCKTWRWSFFTSIWC